MPLGINTQAGMLGAVNFKRNLVAYWAMEETSGNILDSVSSFDLSVDNGATLGATGKNGNAVAFDGTNDVLTIASASSSDLNLAGAFSISAWIRVDTLDSVTQFIAAKFQVGAIQYGLRIEGTTDDVSCFMSSDGSTTTLATSAATLSTATWYHVFGCYDPSDTIRIYINGSLSAENTTSIPASIATGAALFKIGDRTGGSRAFDGIIDEVALWDAYRPELATKLYNAGVGKFYTDF